MKQAGPYFRRVQSPAGFTLIELILVMAILAICAMIAAPKLAGSTRARALPNTATDLVSTTRWCRVQALSDGVHYRLNLSPAEGKWWVTKDDGTGLNFLPVTARMGADYDVPDGVTMETTILPVNDETYIDFGPGGRKDIGSIALYFDEAKIEIKCDSPMGNYHIVDTTPRPQ